jgi:hypothetical protein
MMFYAQETASLQNQLGKRATVLRGVFNDMNLWNAGSTLAACFYDGEPRLKQFFVKTVQRWLSGTSLHVNFGAPGKFNQCQSSTPFDIRISFAQKGSWSYIGVDSVHPDIIAKGPSLNVETNGISFDRLNLTWLEETVLHEFGHALGLLHEHQSPAAHCDEEFDWPKVFAYAKSNWQWDQDEVKSNFAQYVSAPRLRTTPYDKNSVMHYALPAWMYKRGGNSRCYVSEPRSMSKFDRLAILSAYPVAVAEQDKELQRRANVVATTIAKLDLNPDQVATVGGKLASAMSHINHPLRIQLALADSDVVVRSLKRSKLKTCGESAPKPGQTTRIICHVTEDGSSIIIEVVPVTKQ